MIVAYEYVQISHAFLRRCFDNTVLLKQCAYRNRGLFLGRYCDVSSYTILHPSVTTTTTLNDPTRQGLVFHNWCTIWAICFHIFNFIIYVTAAANVQRCNQIMRTYMNARLLAATKLHLESGELAQNQIETNDLMVTDVHIQIV